jgi:hypothetical protein
MPLLPGPPEIDTGRFRRPELPVRYFQVQVANDCYQKTDRYYTGGGLLQYAAPGLAQGPLHRLLPSLPGAPRQTHGVETVLDVFTPADIRITEVQRGDRPYAGYWYAGQFRQSEQPGRGAALRTALHVGVLGPPAAAGRVQTAIHRLIDCAVPEGWDNQVHTDLVLDYQAQYRKRLWSAARVLEAGGLAEARLGTLYNQLRAGATLRVGPWHPRLRAARRSRRSFWCYGAWQGQLTGVGYNATLQGGMFNRSSPYTLRPGRVSRLVPGQTAGVVAGWGKVGIAFGQTWLGREFSGGKAHCWNYVSVRIE